VRDLRWAKLLSGNRRDAIGWLEKHDRSRMA
jgi:hypothetical protein